MPSDDDDDTNRRQLVESFAAMTDESSSSSFSFASDWRSLGSTWQAGMQFLQDKRKIVKDRQNVPSGSRESPHPAAQDWLVRRLQTTQEESSLGPLEGCDVNWYDSSDMFRESRLWPVYKNIRTGTVSLWDGPALQEMCETEVVTQRYLEENNLCLKMRQSRGSRQQSLFAALFTRLVCSSDGRKWPDHVVSRTCTNLGGIVSV